MVSYRLITDESARPLVGGLLSWKWLHIICAALTFAVCVPLIIFLPESPVEAKWLSTEEKVHTIAAIRASHSGIANSAFNWAQAREAFTDVKSWLFMLVALNSGEIYIQCPADNLGIVFICSSMSFPTTRRSSCR
jgi:hypothetical protein